MKLKKFLKLVKNNSDIVVYGLGNSEPAYSGFVGHIPYYLTQFKVVEVDALGDDGYNRLMVVVERDEE